MPPRYAFDVCPPDDPHDETPTRFVIDGNLTDGEYLHLGHGVGGGVMQVHTDHPDATEAVIQKRAWVRFTRIDVDPEREIGCFILDDEGDFDALSKTKERGGRLLTFTGTHGLSVLDRYKLGWAIYAPGQEFRGHGPNVQDYWTWIGEGAGERLTRAIEEGQYHPDAPFGIVQMSFTRTHDSASQPWATHTDYQTRIMTSVLDFHRQAVIEGVVVQCNPRCVIGAWGDIDDFRTDRSSATFASGKLRWEVGVNIANDLSKRIQPKMARSHVLTRRKDGQYQTFKYSDFGLPDPGETYFDALDIDYTSDPTLVANIAREHLKRTTQYVDQAVVQGVIGDDPENGLYDPGPSGDFWVLDLGTIHSGTDEHDFNEQVLEVAAIRFYFDDAGNALYEAQLGAQYIDRSIQRMNDAIVTAIHNVPQGPRLCDGRVNVALDRADSALKSATENGSFPRERAVDGNDATQFSHVASGAVAEDYFAIDLGNAMAVQSYRFLAYSDSEDYATAISIYGSNDPDAWSWLPSGKISANPASNDWTLITSRSGLGISSDTGEVGFGSDQSYRYWLFRATAGSNETNADWDIAEIELWAHRLGGESTEAARCDHNHLVESLATDEIDTSKVLRPDGQGGVEFADGPAAVNVHDLLTAERFIVGAHRGDVNATDGYPENTLEGMRQAALKGAHWIELDVRKSASGTYYLHHDATVNRTTNGTGNVADKTDAQMNTLAIDGGLGYDSGRHGTSLDVPTLESVLDALWPYDVVVQFDNKVPAEAGPLTQWIVEQGWEHRAAVNAYSLDERADIEAVSDVVLVVGGATNQQRGVETPAYSDIVNLAYVTSRIPKIVLGLIPDTEYGDPLDFAAIAEDMFDRGARGLVSHDIDAVLAWWRSYGVTAGASTLNALTDVVIDSPTTGDLLRYDGADWVNVSETEVVEGAGRWEPITHNPGGGPEIMFDGNEILVTFVET